MWKFTAWFFLLLKQNLLRGKDLGFGTQDVAATQPRMLASPSKDPLTLLAHCHQREYGLMVSRAGSDLEQVT